MDMEGVMNKPICWVGIDVGKEELWVAVADRRPRGFTHTTAGVRALVQFCRHVAAAHVLHCCLEATGVYSRSLAVRLLAQPDLQVSIVNPAQIAAFARAQLRRTKTDRLDAAVILAFARSQTPRPWTPEPAALRQLTQLVRTADDLRDTQAAWANRQHAHAWAPDQPAVVTRTDRAMLRAINRQLVHVEEAIQALWQQDPQLRHHVELLCSIPGVAERSAVRLLAYGQQTLATHSAKQLTAHAGLAPRHRLSGTSVRGKSHLAKQGNAQLRRTLYMPALSASRYNPAVKPAYDRLRAAGKPGKLAMAACMRRLLLIARAVIRDNRPFDPNYAGA
jgi:transposase